MADEDYMQLLQTCGIGHLVQMLQKYLYRMKEQDEKTSAYLNNLGLADVMLNTLQTAKSKSTALEIKLLRSIMDNIAEMVNFLESIVLIENTFNVIYDPLRKEQQLSRYKVEEAIKKYEDKTERPLSNDSSFVALIKGSQTHYLHSFASFITEFEYHINKKYRSCSGAKSKGIERAFYKTFYVYDGDFRQILDMLRCSFVFDNFEDLYSAFMAFESYCNSKDIGGILRVKDRFNPDAIPYGYRDLMINIKCPNSEIIAEVQFHHYAFYKFKKQSHRMYKKARLFDRDDKNDAYQYAQIHMRHNLKHDTLLNDVTDNDNDEEFAGIDLDGLEPADKENIDKLSDNLITKFKELNFGPAHIQQCIHNLQRYLNNVREQAKYVEPDTHRLCSTELDDAHIYQHAQNHTIDQFPYGKRLTLNLNPRTMNDFNSNFRVFCKYGLNSLIVDYFDESCKDYSKILNDLIDEHESEETNGSIWDRKIINIMIQYLKAPFSIFDLFRTKNRFNETGMTLAAKYGQSATVEIIIEYANKCNMIGEIINHKANGGSPLFWLFRSYSPDVFKFLDSTNSIRPTMMLLLKNGASVAQEFRVRTETMNVMQLAKLKKKDIDRDILETYMKYQQNDTKSAAEYAIKQNKTEVVNTLKLYHVS